MWYWCCFTLTSSWRWCSVSRTIAWTSSWLTRSNENWKSRKTCCFANLHDKSRCVIQIRNVKQALNHGSVLRKMHRVIKFNQKAWLKSYIDMNTNLRKRAKNDFEKDFFELMNNLVFGKTMESLGKQRDIEL